MTVAEAVRERLLACDDVTALVGQRVWKDVLPPKPTLPAVRVQRISQVEPMHHRGPVGLNVARVQVDSVATKKDQAEEIDAAVNGDGRGSYASGLRGWIGSVGSPGMEIVAVLPAGVRDAYSDAEFRQWRVMRDFMVHYREP